MHLPSLFSPAAHQTVSMFHLRPRLHLSTLHRTLKTVAPIPISPRPPTVAVAVDEFCIPLSPPYSIADYIPAPTPLSREVLTKLYTLSALNPPATEEGWRALESLGGLVAIMEGVRLTSSASSLGSGATSTNAEGALVDGRIRAPSEKMEILKSDRKLVEATGEEEEGDGRTIFRLAQVTEGDYYVVRTPDNIIGKKRKG